jgi:hypothetical protein
VGLAGGNGGPASVATGRQTTGVGPRAGQTGAMSLRLERITVARDNRVLLAGVDLEVRDTERIVLSHGR